MALKVKINNRSKVLYEKTNEQKERVGDSAFT